MQQLQRYDFLLFFVCFSLFRSLKKMLIKDAEYNPKPLNKKDLGSTHIDTIDTNKSPPFTSEPQTFLQENENEFQPSLERTYNHQNKVKRAKTVSFPVDNKEKAKFSIGPNTFKNPESTLRLRNKEQEKLQEENPLISKENVEIKDKEQKNLFTRRIHWSWIIIFLTICAVLIYGMYRLETVHVEESKVHIKMASPRPFEDFANSTTKLVENIIKVDLPSSGSIMDGTVSCRRFANIVEDSPAFKETGSSIAKLLRKFSDSIMDAGIALEDMYRNGDMLFWVLKTEISEMMSKLNPKLFDRLFESEDEAFFKSHIQELIRSIEEFRDKVTSARKYIVDAEGYRGPAERKVRQGITEAKKFINHGPDIHEYRLKLNKEKERYYLEKLDDDKAIDVLNAEEELIHAENMLKILEKSHEALDLINKILSNYRNKLMDVEAQLGKTKKSKVTKKDLEKLEKLVGILESSQQKFIGKDTLGDKKSEKIYV